MIYLSYAIVTSIVVFLSIKAAKYVDLLDKTTNLSGAFIGGILLSTVTSLPELLTSISATVLLDNPGLSLGNILGSNLFNLAILSALILFGINSFKKSKISKSHFMITIFLCLIYIVIVLNMLNILNFEVLTISFTSILILILYSFGLREMANDNSDDKEKEATEVAASIDLTLKQIIIRFIFTSIGLVVFSVLITYITDIISTRLNLGTGFAGALFLGIATSLPEVTSCISLAKIGNFNIAVGNILGSNIFNFLVLFIADVIYMKGNLYLFGDPKTVNLLICGAIGTPLMLSLLKGKKNFTYIISSISIITCYLLFLIL
ncbi:cation transporter [Clostridium sp. VAP51]|uniref:sodium:calcium antiporter n=1 Tax=Clostridium sp. VAP51 TaxID=2949978 RepID=UPI002079DF7F|nr:cation transporter [Clostridium sp. VAP51]